MTIDNRIYDCVFCVHHEECDLEARKDHAYNLRDGTDDCFIPHGKPVPPWLDPFAECYGCIDHSYDNCSICFKEPVATEVIRVKVVKKRVKVVKKRARKNINIVQKSLRNDNAKNIGYDHFCEYEYYDIKDFDTCCNCEYFYDNEMETRFECHRKVRGKECYESKYED